MKDVTARLRSLNQYWPKELSIAITDNAEELVRDAGRDLGRSPKALWQQLANSLVGLEHSLHSNPWFKAQTVHWLEGIVFGAPSRHPELLHPIRYYFHVKWAPDGVVIGTPAEFRLPRNYMSARLLNELAAEHRTDTCHRPKNRD